MAKKYGEVGSSAIMTFDKSFARANGQPLDKSEVYYSLEDAEAYAATDIAYVGQILSVVVTENDKTKVEVYKIKDTAGNLELIGTQADWTAEDGVAKILNKPAINPGTGTDSVVQGKSCQASGLCAFAGGEDSGASGKYSFAFGLNAQAKLGYTLAFGQGSTANTTSSVAIGDWSQSHGIYSLAFGYNAKTGGRGSFAFGVGYRSPSPENQTYHVLASGESSFAFGRAAQATGDYAFAFGSTLEYKGPELGVDLTIASGKHSFAFGLETQAIKAYSFAFGEGVHTTNSHEVAFGRYNSSAENETLFSIGNGDNIKRSNLFQINQNGAVYLASLEDANAALDSTPVQQHISNLYSMGESLGWFDSRIGDLEARVVALETKLNS